MQCPYALRSRVLNNNKQKTATPLSTKPDLKKTTSKKKKDTASTSKSKNKKSLKIVADNNKSKKIKSIPKIKENNTIDLNESNILQKERNMHNIFSDSASLKTINAPLAVKSQSTTESLQLKKVFLRSYIDIVNRMKLNTAPECLIKLLHCKETHSEDCAGPLMANHYIKSKIYLVKENRLLTLSKIANSITNKGCFWGNEIFFTIFRIILTVKSSEELHCTPDYVIEEYLLLFENLIKTFPPCWKKVHPEYVTFLLSEIKTIEFLPQKPDLKMPNIVIFILNEIEEVCQEENNEPCTEEEQIIPDSSQFFNYNIWEAEQMKENLLFEHSREEKLNRLFICLQLINKIFEMELSSWMIWKLSPSDFIFTKDGPLICQAFNITEFTFVNHSIKKFCQLFIKCVCCKYSKECVNIMERLLSLIAIVSNLADISASNNGISYPKTGKITDIFVTNFFKIMENIIGTNIQMYFAVIEAITIPFMKYKLINLVLSKIESVLPKKFCLQVIYDNLKKYSWLECSDSGSLTLKNPVGPTVDSKYPSLNISKKTTPTECYQEEYLKILLDAIKSYCDFYCLNKFALILMNKPSELYLNIKTPYSFNSNNILNDVQIDLKYDTINESKINKMLDSIDYSSTIVIDQHNVVSNDIIKPDVLNIGLLTDEEQLTYLNDMQCMMKIKKNLLQLNKKYAGQFDEWCKYFDEFFANP